jgi:ABC-type multidrug transport system fused ATPase/permease subunit
MSVIETQLADRTVVLITHRPPRARRTSRILVLDHGRLAGHDPGEARDRRAGLAVAP